MFDRWAIDDGLHLPRFEEDFVASAKLARDAVAVSCSCGRMARTSVPVDERLVPHLAHLRLSQQIKGSARREGLRLLLLAIADFVVFMGFQILGDQVVPHPAGIEAISARLGFVLAGFAAAGALTVALRRTVAPARLPRVPEA